MVLVVAEPTKAMDVGSRGVNQHTHLGQLRTDTIVLDQRFAALDTNFGPTDRLLIQGDGNAKNGGTGIGVRLREEFGQDVKTFADFANDVFVGNKALLEDKFGVVS